MIDLSIVVVSYNVQAFLERTLESVFKARQNLNLEVFVVDNASEDDSVAMVRDKFPHVELIASEENLGFSKANNLALKKARGRYLMLLNPDCLVGEDSLTTLVEFMDQHPQAGAAGPKLLNQDGSFQATCKRGLPSPWVSFCKLSGLSCIFPKSNFFNHYEMGYLDPDEINEIEVLSGAAFLLRREVYEQVGGLDEDYFMFGEDIDWCFSILKAGWKIYYVPTTQIIHYKGQSSRRSSTSREKHFYNAMRLYARKHSKTWFLGRIFIETGILLGEISARLSKNIADWFPVVLDFLILLLVFYLSFLMRFGSPIKNEVWIVIGLYPIITSLSLSLTGLYKSNRQSSQAILYGILIGFAIVSTLAYFVKPIQFSRLVIVMAAGLTLTAMYGWRYLVLRLGWRYWRRRMIIVGTDHLARQVLEKIKSGCITGLQPVGWAVSDSSLLGKTISGYPVLGLTDELAQIIEQNRLDEVLFSTQSFSYEEIFNLVANKPLKGARVQVIPQGFNNQQDIPLLELDISNGLIRRLVKPGRSQDLLRK